MTRRNRFGWTWFAIAVLGFTVASVATPPDPFTQLLAIGVLVLLTAPVAYWLVYREGFDRAGVPYRRLPVAVVAGSVAEIVFVAAWRAVRPAALGPADVAELGYAMNATVGVVGILVGWWLVASGRITRRGFHP